MVVKNFNNRVKNFGIRFEEEAYDEGKHQQQMVAFLKANHQEVNAANATIGEALSEVLWHCEKPILRTAPILGPTVRNTLTRYLSHRVVPTILGFDPLWQFLHEADAVAAFKLAIDRGIPGTFNIVGEGVLPLSTAIRLCGRTSLPLPRSVANSVVGALWLAQLAEAPPAFLDYLQYLCVADGAQALKVLGFAPAYTSREALVDYANAQQLRDAKLLSETSQ